MSEDAEMYRAHRQQSRLRRARNRENSAAILQRHSVAFDSMNDGAHLIVTHAGAVFDFWPGTGKYVRRGESGYRCGVFNLLRTLNVEIINQPGE